MLQRPETCGNLCKTFQFSLSAVSHHSAAALHTESPPAIHDSRADLSGLQMQLRCPLTAGWEASTVHTHIHTCTSPFKSYLPLLCKVIKTLPGVLWAYVHTNFISDERVTEIDHNLRVFLCRISPSGEMCGSICSYRSEQEHILSEVTLLISLVSGI